MAEEFEIKEGAYPKHIFDPIRIEIVVSYVKHEFKKNLEGYSEQDIDGWFEKLDPRDFWNAVHGIAMGFKLKNGMMQNITAENVSWKKEDFYLESLSSQLNLDKWRGKKGTIDDYIIILKKRRGDGEYFGIFDGHRRASLAVLDGRRVISAYVGEYTTEEWVPKNFWLPTSFLQDLVENGEYTGNYKTTLEMLKGLIDLSESGAYELRERVLVGGNEFRMRLKKELFKQRD